MAARRRTIRGVLPWLASTIWRGVCLAVRHPRGLITLGVVLACGWTAGRSIATSDAFRITDVRIPAGSRLRVPVSSLKGRNLWTVDLAALEADLKAQQPHLKRVRVIRLLPRTLGLEVVERVPVAQLFLSGWHPVDADGYILPQAGLAPLKQLVILKGVDSPKQPLKVGHANTNARLSRALQLMEQLHRSPLLVGHRLTTVDIADPAQLTFVIDENVEIRCGDDTQLASHLRRLRTVLQQVARHGLEVRYIDLRFPDPVIGPRT